VISQVNGFGLNDDEAQRLIAPDPRYGPRGDVVWVTEETPPEE
jgi:hypothetical protein